MKVGKVSAVSKQVGTSGFAVIRSVPEDLYNTFLKRYPTLSKNFLVEKFNNIEDIPEAKKLLEFMKKDINAPVPENATMTIQVGIFNRYSCTYMDPPEETSAMRILFNLGFGETYKFKDDYTIGNKRVLTGLDPKTVYIEANQYCLVGTYNMSNYQIYVEKGPYSKIPKLNPNEPPESVLRSGDYKRITVIIDFNVTQELAESLNNMTPTKMSKITVSGKGGNAKKDIEKQIRSINEKVNKQMSNGINNTQDAELEKIMNDTISNVNNTNTNTNNSQDAELEKIMDNIVSNTGSPARLNE